MLCKIIVPSASEKTGISRSFVVIHKRSVWAWWALSEGEIEYHLRVYVLILSILQYTFLIHIRDHFIVYWWYHFSLHQTLPILCYKNGTYRKGINGSKFLAWNISQSVLIGSFSHDVANIYWTPFVGCCLEEWTQYSLLIIWRVMHWCIIFYEWIPKIFMIKKSLNNLKVLGKLNNMPLYIIKQWFHVLGLVSYDKM